MTKKTEICACCGELFSLSEVNWVDDALTVCVCDACYRYATDDTCECCGGTLFVSTNVIGGLYCPVCDEHVMQ